MLNQREFILSGHVSKQPSTCSQLQRHIDICLLNSPNICKLKEKIDCMFLNIIIYAATLIHVAAISPHYWMVETERKM